MKKEVVITGGGGRIASIIAENLSDEFSFTLLDKKANNPKVKILDVAEDYPGLKKEFSGKNAVIHLAWDSEENWRSGITKPGNIKMAGNAYKAAFETGVKRIIVASSIHADDFRSQGGLRQMTIRRQCFPTNPYGQSKIKIEDLGGDYAMFGLEVVCIRFGGVDPQDKVRSERDYWKIFLSRRDCANLIRCCLEAEKIPGNFCVIYGVSDNTGRIHDWTNPLGWTPRDDSSKM